MTTTKNAQALKARVLEELALLASAPDSAEFTETGPDGVSRLRPEVIRKKRAARAIEVSLRGVKIQVHNKSAALKELRRTQMGSNPLPGGYSSNEE